MSATRLIITGGDPTRWHSALLVALGSGHTPVEDPEFGTGWHVGEDRAVYFVKRKPQWVSVVVQVPAQ